MLPSQQHPPDYPPAVAPAPSAAMDHSTNAPPYGYRIVHQHPQQQPPDFTAHMQMAHIPLPLDTPLPPSSYDFTGHGAFQVPATFQGPQGHPLFEGVVAMHQMLGHDLNLAWPDVAGCNQQSQLSYADGDASQYACADALTQWASPPPSIVDPTPSPLEGSLPHTPEHVIELVPETCIQQPESPPPPSQAQATAGYAVFPVVVSGAKTHEHTVAFQSDRQTSEKAGSKFDPFAADFIREKLGVQRWCIFSSRLAEKRTTSQKAKSRSDGATSPSTDAFAADRTSSASVIDFLVKVEVVKGVLRTFVPHPYNPLKTLSHAYDRAPSGQVTLSRSTVLSLSGWSNTQFSYWARRAEAISVLGMHDQRLRTVATALQRRLRSSGLSDIFADPSSPSSSHSPHSIVDFDRLSRPVENDPEEWVKLNITGKGLDVIIDDVKKRTGVSPFLRGKHSSLDPFGTVSVETEGASSGRKAPVYMPTFQAEQYVHEVPAELDPATVSGMIVAKRAMKRKATSPLRDNESDDTWHSIGSDVSAEDNMSLKTPSSRTHSASPPLIHSRDELPSYGSISTGYDSPYQTNYSDHHHLPRLALQLPNPNKRRRLAPAPPHTSPSDIIPEPFRLYHNHLQTG